MFQFFDLRVRVLADFDCEASLGHLEDGDGELGVEDALLPGEVIRLAGIETLKAQHHPFDSFDENTAEFSGVFADGGNVAVAQRRGRLDRESSWARHWGRR